MMQRIFFLLLFSLGCLQGFSQEPDSLPLNLKADKGVWEQTWESKVKKELAKLLEDPLFQTSQVGLCVYDLTADSMLFAYNSLQRMRPASTLKLITALAGLDYLGDSYRFETTLYYVGDIIDKVLWGDIYIKGSMDPLFGKDDMSALVQSVKKRGIDSIAGKIYLDLSLKEGKTLGAGWCWDDENPTLNPLLYRGKPAFFEYFLQESTMQGLAVPNVFDAQVVPEGAVKLESRWHTLPQVLQPMLKQSDNLCAEAVFYQLAQSISFAKDVDNARNIKKWLKGIDPQGEIETTIADGSGLSPYNYTTVACLTKVLRHAYRNQVLYSNLLPALPIAGNDGTLKKRMQGTSADYNVVAKTGTLTGVSTLAGYASSPVGNRLAFVIFNQGVKKASLAKRFQDKVCLLLTADL